MKNQRVVVTGLSAITPLGKNIQETWAGIMANKTGIRNIAGDNPAF
jgi:3-oxoacyl-[acyl-carrier-protein] synthase II